MNGIHDVIEAFADGESVDPAQLTQALSQAEGREHLIDLLVLRGLIGGPRDPEKTSEVFLRFSKKDLRGLFAMAALVAVGVLGGFLAGQRIAATRPAGPATTVANSAPQIVPVSAPSPTRVIQLQNGVDWNERGGGN